MVRSLLTVAATATVTVAALAGCGSSTSKADKAPLTAEEACLRLNEAGATLSARCSGGSVADWASSQLAIQDCATFTRHVAEGLAEYRPAGWAECLAQHALPCGEADPYPCYYEILHGKVADGQRCEDTQVCGTVSACLNVTGQDCADVCARFGVENEPCGVHCGASVPCADGPYCGLGLFCLDGTCVKARRLGEACGGAAQITCESGLFCNASPADPTASGVCAHLAVGGACQSDTGCLFNEFCLAGTCTPRRTAGSPCADAFNGGCVPWTVCDLAGSQLCVPAGRTGQRCGAIPGTEQLFNCIVGACNGTLCLPMGALGDDCASGTCVQGEFCNANATCQLCGP